MALENLYLQTNKLVQETQHAFERLEKVTGPNIDVIEKEIETKIATITSNCERLDVLLYKEPVHRRQNAKLKIDQLKYDNQHLRAGFSMYQHRRQQRLIEEREREELLNRRFAPNSETDTSILIDHSLQHNMSLQNSHRGMDAVLITGSGILENLRDQRTTIKGAQRRLFDIANSLGLSNTTMRLIEKRASQDKLILFGGMLFTCVVMFIVVSYFT